MQEEGRRWSIDALDADGGIAFASFRQSGEADIGDLEVEHAVVVAAPHFRPVPVSSRALSLGAISQGAQSGVYGDSGEVRFDSLDQLVEFVRKVYVGGGASGATPAPETVPNPPEGPNEDEGAGEEQEDWGQRVASHMIADWLALGVSESDLGRPSLPPFSDELHYRGHQIIARAAVSIGISLIERMPYPDDPIEDQSRWIATTDHFMWMLRCIDMSAFVMDPSMHELLTSCGIRLLNDPKRSSYATERENTPIERSADLAWATYDLVIEGTVGDPFYNLDILYRYRRYRDESHAVSCDVFSTLAELPIPVGVGRLAGLRAGASVADFVAHCCATSTIEADSPTATGVLVFAAFCLVASSRISVLETGGRFSSALFQVAHRDAMQWLSQQFGSRLPEELRHMVIGAPTSSDSREL